MTGPGERWRAVARRNAGEDYAQRFVQRFAELEQAGEDVHGEAAYVAGLLAPGARVLDAGCGTGRVAARLADLGFEVVGADVDESMIAVARERRPDLRWIVSDLGSLELGTVTLDGERFNAVVLAGNVVPFVEVEELPRVAERFASLLVAGGLVVAGYGLDAAHVPPGTPLVPLPTYDAAMTAAGFTLATRLSGWDGTPYAGGGYAVSVHRSGERGADRG